MKGNDRGYGIESLPNITGDFQASSQIGFRDNTTSGAFVQSNISTELFVGRDTQYTGYRMGFDASRSSPTYKDGAKVNPDHVYVNFIVKY